MNIFPHNQIIDLKAVIKNGGREMQNFLESKNNKLNCKNNN